MESIALELTSNDVKPLPHLVNLPISLECVICKHALRGPIQTQCGHRICNPCYCAIMREEVPAKCPGGEDDCVTISPETVNPDMCVKRELDRLLVYCSFEEYGCTETMQWVTLDNHQSQCQFAVKTCPTEGCAQTIRKVDIAKHVDEECKYILVACPQCRIMVGRGFKEQHLQEDCEEVTISCPYKCGEQSVKRRDLAGHKEQCTNKPQKCRFNLVGCKYQGSQSDILHHHADNTTEHLALVAHHCVEIKRTVDHLHNDLAQTVVVADDLRKGKQRLEEVICSQQNLCDTQIQKVQNLEVTLSKTEQAIAELQREAKLVKEKIEQKQINQNSSLRVLQETQLRHDRRLGDIERMRLADNPEFTRGNNLRGKAARQDAQLAMFEIRMAEMNLRFQCLESTNYSGVLIWRLNDFAMRKREAVTGKNVSLYSQPFYTDRHGYKMCARVYLNGDGLGKGTHISLFFAVMKGDYDPLLNWPFKKKVTLMLLDQCGGRRQLSDTFRPDPSSSSFMRPVNEMNVASGCPLFVEQTLAQGPPYLVEDTIFFKVTVAD